MKHFTFLVMLCLLVGAVPALCQAVVPADPTPPVLVVEGKVYVPLRPVMEWLGGNVQYDTALNVITVTLSEKAPADTPPGVRYVPIDGLKTVLRISLLDGKLQVVEPAWAFATTETLPTGPVYFPLAAPPVQKNGVTYLPASAIRLLFGVHEEWDLASTGLLLVHWRAAGNLILPTDPAVQAPWLIPLG